MGYQTDTATRLAVGHLENIINSFINNSLAPNSIKKHTNILVHKGVDGGRGWDC